MKTLGVIANCSKPRASIVLSALEKEAAKAGLSLITDADTGTMLKSATIIDEESLFSQAEAIMVLGGDGTLIKVVRQMKNHNKPIIGVNIGALGFLTSVAEDELSLAIECLIADNYKLSNRAILTSSIIRDGETIASYNALNDIVITRESSTRLIMLDVTIDEQDVTSYRCDGLIISTPTGSTGHSMSAGGPILMPETKVFVMSLICPHTLSSRPLVVTDNSRVSISTARNDNRLLITADGQIGQALECGDKIEIHKSAQDIQLITLPEHSYFSVLRQKLGWRGSSI
ncbi:MAG: NAD(+)/NADH kinase [Kiritimatiellae bacterium]|nr:NAD(+)/NADH kinase [Kiritimatiellia bacterium]